MKTIVGLIILIAVLVGIIVHRQNEVEKNCPADAEILYTPMRSPVCARRV